MQRSSLVSLPSSFRCFRNRVGRTVGDDTVCAEAKITEDQHRSEARSSATGLTVNDGELPLSVALVRVAVGRAGCSVRGPPGVSERGLVHERLLEVDVRVLDVLSERSNLSDGLEEPERDERRKRCEKRRDRKKWGWKEGRETCGWRSRVSAKTGRPSSRLGRKREAHMVSPGVSPSIPIPDQEEQDGKRRSVNPLAAASSPRKR